MLIGELLPKIQQLSRADKLRVMQFLASSLAEEEGITELKSDTTYRIWSPYNSHDAAHKLAKLLEEEQEIECAV